MLRFSEFAQMTVRSMAQQMHRMYSLEAFEQQKGSRPVGDQDFLDGTTNENHAGIGFAHTSWGITYEDLYV